MKIAIYGVSRSGKDYLIEELTEYLVQRNVPLYHVKGSKMLNKISMSKYQKQFKILSETEKDICRKEFISRLSQLESQYKNIVVDGHYSFFDRNMNTQLIGDSLELRNCGLKFYLKQRTNNSVIT